MWMAGGGVKGGQTIGATDELGLHAVEDRLHVHDLHATILHLLGLDNMELVYRTRAAPSGRRSTRARRTGRLLPDNTARPTVGDSVTGAGLESSPRLRSGPAAERRATLKDSSHHFAI